MDLFQDDRGDVRIVDHRTNIDIRVDRHCADRGMDLNVRKIQENNRREKERHAG